MLWNDGFAEHRWDVGSGVLGNEVPGSAMCQELPPETCGYTNPIPSPFPLGFLAGLSSPRCKSTPAQAHSITLSKAAAPEMLWLRRLHRQPGFARSHRGRGFANEFLKLQMGLEEKHRGLHIAILGGAQRLCCRASKGRLGPSLLQCLGTSGKPLTPITKR